MMSSATKFDTGKPACDLLPPDVLLDLGWLMGFGAAKYGVRNWEKGFRWGRLIAALLRHLF